MRVVESGGNYTLLIGEVAAAGTDQMHDRIETFLNSRNCEHLLISCQLFPLMLLGQGRCVHSQMRGQNSLQRFVELLEASLNPRPP